VTDQEPVAVAILAALNAVTGVDAYDLDEVPGTNGLPGSVPQRCVVIDVGRINGGTRRFGGSHTTTANRVDTIYRADNLSNCRELRRLVSTALEDVALGSYGPFVFNDE
jgi:hypothetical protein